MSPKERVRALLQVGTDRLELESAFVARTNLAESKRCIVVATGPHPKLQEGAEAALSSTYARAVVTRSEPLVIEDAEAQGWAGTEPQQALGFSCYLGAKVVVEELYGTVCFGSRESKERPFGEEDEKTLRLLARAIGRVIRRSRQKQSRQHQGNGRPEGKYQSPPGGPSRLKSAMLAGMSNGNGTPPTPADGPDEKAAEESRQRESSGQKEGGEERTAEPGPLDSTGSGAPENDTGGEKGVPLEGNASREGNGHYADLIENAGEPVIRRLIGLLDLSKLEAEEAELTSPPTDLSATAQSAADQVVPRGKAGVTVRVGALGAPIWARTDERGVKMALSNLLPSVVKHTERGEQVWIRAYKMGEQAVLEVEDTGIGPDPQAIECLSEPFRQGAAPPGPVPDGIASGLSALQQLAKGMGGSVKVESPGGEESRITIFFPQAG